MPPRMNGEDAGVPGAEAAVLSTHMRTPTEYDQINVDGPLPARHSLVQYCRVHKPPSIPNSALIERLSARWLQQHIRSARGLAFGERRMTHTASVSSADLAGQRLVLRVHSRVHRQRGGEPGREAAQIALVRPVAGVRQHVRLQRRSVYCRVLAVRALQQRPPRHSLAYVGTTRGGGGQGRRSMQLPRPRVRGG